MPPFTYLLKSKLSNCILYSLVTVLYCFSNPIFSQDFQLASNNKTIICDNASFGPPGCGKSSLIKSTIKYTKRHCVLVSWSRIKTCSDFVSLFRPIKIDKKVYNQDQLIIVFEDFDANENNVLKKRHEIKSKLFGCHF